MSEHDGTPTRYDLIILGSGSGNSLVTPEMEARRTAVVEEGIFGGTCLNVGCIPTKMFVYAAEVATAVREAGRYGVDATLDGVRWRDIRDRIFGRIDPISDGGRDYRRDAAHTDAYLGHGRFVGPHEIEVEITRPEGGLPVGSRHRITADQIVIATGSHPVVPDVVTASGVPFHTSATVMRIDDLPARMAILGGGVIAAEFAHVFSALGVQVEVVARGERLLSGVDEEISALFTEVAGQHWGVRTGTTVAAARQEGAEVVLDLSDGTVLRTDLLLVATGRRASTEDLGLGTTAVRTHPDGRVVVDEHGRTDEPGVWALGDVSSPYQLKHVANQEARVVAHNLLVTEEEELQSFDHRFVPAAVFSHPQVATVGLTEREAREQGFDVVTKTQRYGDTAYGWAMEDSTSVLKLVADRPTGHLLGAHGMGPHASTVIQPVIQALSLATPAAGTPTVVELARRQYWIHPALSEVLENALLGLDVAPYQDVTADYDPEGETSATPDGSGVDA